MWKHSQEKSGKLVWQTDRMTDRLTDGQTDRVQTYSPLRFHRWGTNKAEWQCWSWVELLFNVTCNNFSVIYVNVGNGGIPNHTAIEQLFFSWETRCGCESLMLPVATKSKSGKISMLHFYPVPMPRACNISEMWTTHGWTYIPILITVSPLKLKILHFI